MRTVLVIVACLFSFSYACGDAFHAHCELHWTFPNAKCSDILAIFISQFKSCCLEPSITKNYTNYQLSDYSYDDLKVSGKIKFTDGYVDQQAIALTQKGTNCTAIACSQSESLSYYDYEANFCDAHNLVRNIGYVYTETATQCRFKPAKGQEDIYCNNQ